MQITRLETDNPTHRAERNVKHGQLPSQILTQAVNMAVCRSLPYSWGEIFGGGKTGELKTKDLSKSICSSVKMGMKQAVVKIK